MRFEDDVDGPTRLTDYIEKPTLSYEVVDGRLRFDPRVLGHIERERAARLPRPGAAAARRGRAGARRTGRDAYWLDLGRHDDYEQALSEFEAAARPAAARSALTRGAHGARPRVDVASSWREESGSARWRSAAASAAGSEPGAASGASSVSVCSAG